MEKMTTVCEGEPKTHVSTLLINQQLKAALINIFVVIMHHVFLMFKRLDVVINPPKMIMRKHGYYRYLRII